MTINTNINIHMKNKISHNNSHDTIKHSFYTSCIGSQILICEFLCPKFLTPHDSMTTEHALNDLPPLRH